MEVKYTKILLSTKNTKDIGGYKFPLPETVTDRIRKIAKMGLKRATD